MSRRRPFRENISHTIYKWLFESRILEVGHKVKSSLYHFVDLFDDFISLSEGNIEANSPLIQTELT